MATNSGLVWSVQPDVMIDRLTLAYVRAIHRGVEGIAQRRAPEIEAWMKANALWIDRTSNARQTLHTEVQTLAGSMVQIVLAGGVDYFIFLELAHAGRYAIIAPALDFWGPVVWDDVRTMLR